MLPLPLQVRSSWNLLFEMNSNLVHLYSNLVVHLLETKAAHLEILVRLEGQSEYYVAARFHRRWATKDSGEASNPTAKFPKVHLVVGLVEHLVVATMDQWAASSLLLVVKELCHLRRG